jgi:hypothetical protein
MERKVPGFVAPMILEKLKPGEKMILTVNYSIPDKEDSEKDVSQIYLQLNSKGFGDFGEKLILTYHVDDELFDLKSKVTGDTKLSERVKII